MAEMSFPVTKVKRPVKRIVDGIVDGAVFIKRPTEWSCREGPFEVSVILENKPRGNMVPVWLRGACTAPKSPKDEKGADYRVKCKALQRQINQPSLKEFEQSPVAVRSKPGRLKPLPTRRKVVLA